MTSPRGESPTGTSSVPFRPSAINHSEPGFSHTHWPHIYFGVAATALATLLLELALTRVFSVVYYYHFAFLAISLALFGLGAGGVFSYAIARGRGSLFSKLGVLGAINAAAIVICLAYLLSRVHYRGGWEL